MIGTGLPFPSQRDLKQEYAHAFREISGERAVLKSPLESVAGKALGRAWRLRMCDGECHRHSRSVSDTLIDMPIGTIPASSERTWR